jgi:hypothetical protein
MFGIAFIFLFLSLAGVLLGTSGIVGGASLLFNVLALMFLLSAMASLRSQWKPRSTCFIYPTFSCST